MYWARETSTTCCRFYLPVAFAADQLRSLPCLIRADGAASLGGPSLANPWGLRCYEKQILGRGGLHGPGSALEQARRCLLLEDVLSEFVRPCVLDLKVGVRTYRDDASPEKRRRAIEKAGQTTTASLGFRLCGMQVFDQGSSQFLCRNKYYGRRLTDLTVKVCAAFHV